MFRYRKCWVMNVWNFTVDCNRTVTAWQATCYQLHLNNKGTKNKCNLNFKPSCCFKSASNTCLPYDWFPRMLFLLSGRLSSCVDSNAGVHNSFTWNASGLWTYDKEQSNCNTYVKLIRLSLYEGLSRRAVPNISVVVLLCIVIL